MSETPPAHEAAVVIDHRAAERDYWKQQLRISCALNLNTAIGGLAAIVGLFFVAKGLVESHNATVAANRAWMDSTGISPTGKN